MVFSTSASENSSHEEWVLTAPVIKKEKYIYKTTYNRGLELFLDKYINIPIHPLFLVLKIRGAENVQTRKRSSGEILPDRGKLRSRI